MNTPYSTDRANKETERPAREASRSGTTPETATEAPRSSTPPMFGVWSSDGRLFSPLGLNDNTGATERLLQGWQEALDSQRAMLDAMRDMIRRQQDLMLTAARSMCGAAMDPEHAATGQGRADVERCAAQYGAAWRRGLDQAWANYWAVLENPVGVPTAANEANMTQRPGRTG
jgi:hypothetical protein